MNFIHYLKLYTPRSGLCNQINSLVTSIFEAYKFNLPIVFVEEFMIDIFSEKLKPASEIFDFKAINRYIKPKYNVYLVDSKKINLRIPHININNTNIIEKYKDIFFKNNIFHIPKDYHLLDDLSSINGTLKISFIFDNNIEIPIEIPIQDGIIQKELKIYLDPAKMPFRQTNGWKSAENGFIFNDIIKEIRFQQFFYDNNFKWFSQRNLVLRPFHTVHLRIEDDAIKHWSVQNHMSDDVYRETLENKYIHLICKYCAKNEPIILLTYDENNRVFRDLKANGYEVYVKEKDLSIGREVNAIYDMLLADSTGGVFIGGYSSSFTQAIFFRNSDLLNCVFFNLHEVFLNEFTILPKNYLTHL